MTETTNNTPQPGSDIEKKLGIDQIQDAEKREIVKTYFEKTLTPDQRAGLIHEKAKSDLSKLKQQIDSLNQRHASVEEFIQEIITTMQKDVLERDLNDGYVENGSEQGSYVDYFMNLCGFGGGIDPPAGWEKYKDKGFKMDWDDLATWNYCIDKVKNVIRSVPANVKRETRTQFAKDFMTAYAQAIDSYDQAFENFDMGEINEPEQKIMKEQPYLLNFNAWLAQKGMKMEDVTYQYSKMDTKAILDTKSKLEGDKKNLGAYPKAQQDYYTQQIQNIEGFALNNPAQAQEQLANLEKDMGAMTAFVAFGTEVFGADPTKKSEGLYKKFNDFKSKYSDFDDKFSGQIDDLQKKYTDTVVKIDAEKDPQKRLVLMDLTGELKTTKDKIDFDMVKASEDSAKKLDEANKNKKAEEDKAKTEETAAAAAETPAEKPGFLDQAVLGDSKLGDMVKKLAKDIPLIGSFILGAFLSKSTLEKLGIKGPTSLDGFFEANGTPKTPEQLKEIESKAKGILKDQFKIETTAELDTLSKTTVKDFLKKKPDNFDQKRYDAFTAALKKNGATDSISDKKVFEFVLLKTEEWKS